MKKSLYVICSVCLLAVLAGCSNPFPEDKGLYSVVRGATPEAAVEITVPFDASQKDQVKMFLGSELFTISMKSSTDSSEYPATCSVTVEEGGDGQIACAVADVGQALSNEAQTIQVIIKKAIAGDDVEWFAQDLIWWEIGTGKDAECRSTLNPQCGQAMELAPNLSCIKIMRGTDAEDKQHCTEIREQCFYKFDCLGIKLLAYSFEIAGAEDSYSSPELDLAAIAVDCQATPDAEGCGGSDSVTIGGDTKTPIQNGGGNNGGGGGSFDVESGDGCALIGTAAVNPFAFILFAAALLPLLRGRQR